MARMKTWIIAAAVVAIVAAAAYLYNQYGFRAAPPMEGLHPDHIRLPGGFVFEVYADDVPGARSMALGDRGTVFVGTRDEGRVYAVRDGGATVTAIAEGLDTPNGVAFRDGDLYVAEVSRILRFDDIESRIDDPPDPEVFHDGFPTDRHHGWKFIAFGPDGRLYVPVGAPGNNILRDDPVYSSITRVSPDGSSREIFAHGVRNTVGFDFHPETGELWFTDNGRDWMGDDEPPDELNRAPEKGLHFGFPFRHGNGIEDPDYGDEAGGRAFTKPEILLGAHVAALGMRFYDAAAFPEEYRGAIFIAEHGSWNRTEFAGYRVTVVRIENGRAKSYEPFATGWLVGGRAWGRPVDVLVHADGSLLVSDDRAGAIYRIARRRENPRRG